MSEPFTRCFVRTLGIEAPVDFAQRLGGQPNLVLLQLNRDYGGRCADGVYVVRVTRVIEQSRMLLRVADSSGAATKDVRFEAEVVVFAPGDLLPAVALKPAAPGLPRVGEVSLDRAPAAAVAFAPPAAGDASPGPGEYTALVPVRIVGASHPPGARGASVVGRLLTCERGPPPAYRLAAPLRAGKELAAAVSRVEAELAARLELPPDARERLQAIETLLYAYSASKAVGETSDDPDSGWLGPAELRPLPPGCERRSLLATARAALGGEPAPVEGVWSRPLSLHRSSPWAAWAADASPAGSAEATAAPTGPTFLLLLGEVAAAMRVAREMALRYVPFEDHGGLWRTLVAAQARA